MSKKYPIPYEYKPLNYDQINNIEGHRQPSMMKYCNSVTYAYWQRSLFQRAISTIDFTGLPEEWEGSVRDFFYWCIFAYGYVGVFDSPEFGISFQPGNLKGFDFYYQPVQFIVANPKLKGSTGTFEIHKTCELIKLTPDWRGIWDIICYYAMLLSLLDSGITGSITGTKFSYLLGAKNKSAAETIKAIFTRIFSGEPAVVYDNNLLPNDPNSKDEPFQFIERSNLKSSYLVTDQLMDRSTLLSSFDAEIGIRSLPYNKKERLVTAEAESREQDSTARLMVWKKTLDSSLEQVNKMFDLNIKVELTYDKEVSDNGEDNIDRNGTVPES
jgi:hypothetical protein